MPEQTETSECPVCAEAEEPCKACRRRIHEGWHKRGWWWIRPEECHVECPGKVAKQLLPTLAAPERTEPHA